LDATLAQPLLVVPLPSTCSAAKITTLGHAHCNWAVDTQGGHSLEDLFAPSGVQLNSWNKTYGSTVLGGKSQTLAIVLQDGHFLTGQHYAPGYTYSERRFTEPALAQGLKALDHVLRKVYAAGFVDGAP
jgi:hypothetical protein